MKNIIVILIVITLIYVAFRLRQNTDSVRWTYDSNNQVTGYINDDGIWIKKP